MHRYALAAALFAAPVSAPHAQDRILITRSAIEAGGWLRLGEALFHLGAWQRSSVDGLAMDASPDGLPPLAPNAAGGWRVLVDGREIPVTFAGIRNLELLPISLAQVESITVTRDGRLAGGALGDRATVHFHSRAPEVGSRIIAKFQLESETADPGPYLFTPLATENIDHNGPYHTLLAEVGTPRWDLTFGYRRAVESATDVRIADRLDRGDPDAPDFWLRMEAPTVRVGGSLLGGRHDFIVGRALFRGLAFVPERWEEESLRASQFHASGAGRIPLGWNGRAVVWRLGHSTLDVTEAPSNRPFTVGHSRSRLDPGVELHFPAGAATGVIGAGALTSSLRTPAAAERTLTEGSILGALARPLTSSLAGRVDLELRHSPLGAGGGGTVELSTPPGASRGVVARVHGRTRRGGENGNWMDLALAGRQQLEGRSVRSAWAELAGFTRAAAWRADAAARVTTAELLVPDGSLTLGELRAAVALPALPHLEGNLTARVFVPLAAGAHVRPLLDATARHQLEGHLIFTPARDFRLATFVSLVERSDWSALVPGFGFVPDDPVVPTVGRVDLAVEHRFWRRQLRAQFLVRNAFNASERYHPLGAHFGMGVRLTLALEYPPLPPVGARE